MPKANQPQNIFKRVVEDVVEEKLQIFRGENIFRFDALEQKLDEFEKRANERHDLVMKALDTVMGMFKKHDEEHVILSDQQRRINETNERLDQLEKIHPGNQHPTPQL